LDECTNEDECIIDEREVGETNPAWQRWPSLAFYREFILIRGCFNVVFPIHQVTSNGRGKKFMFVLLMKNFKGDPVW
jgi:hypothetical protein